MSFREAARWANAALAAAHLDRRIDARDDAPVDFASNDYLGLANDAGVRAALGATERVGSSGSRLLSGAHAEHDALERELASFLGRERVRVFSSGYLAVLGAVQVAADLVRAIRSDRENHACAIDAIRLARLPCVIYDGLPAPNPRDEATLVVTESLFSMSGRIADLRALLAGMAPADALVVDEAHAIGVFGPQGRGFAFGIDDDRVVVAGTLSKALGCAGGFVAGTAEFVDLVTSTARTFIFDTSLPPGVAAAARVALERVERGDALRARLFANVETFWRELGVAPPSRPTQIANVMIGDNARARAVARALRARGYFAPAIRPPTVPAGTERLRVSVRADHDERDVAAFARALRGMLAELA